MSRILWVVIAVLAVVLILHEVAAAAEPAIIDQKIEAPDKLTVGDHFVFTIKVETDTGTNVFLAPGGLPPAFELAKTPESTSRNKGNGRTETTIRLELAAFVPGEAKLDDLALRYRTSTGTNGDLKIKPASVNVTSVLPQNEAPTPRDLKPQAEIGKPPSTWMYYAAGAIVLALVLTLGLIYWRLRVLKRRAAYVPPEPEADPVTPEDWARGELDRAGREFASGGAYGDYYASMGVTIRKYLTTRYGFGAFALTTVELQNEMQQKGLDRWQARLVSGLLTQCDSAVYAGYRPANERADADLTAAYEIVEMSRPEPVAVEVAAT